MTAAKVKALRDAALSWVGTPFCVRGAVRGGGVSCHRLCVEIYREAGFLPSDFAAPHGRADWARWRKHSQMADWLDASMWFTRARFVAPGNLLGLQGQADGCINHLAVMLDQGELVHCMRHTGVQIVPLADPTFFGSVREMWRPTTIHEPHIPNPL